jgi:DHA3 family macrolide efflux protein-like MFS transporter
MEKPTRIAHGMKIFTTIWIGQFISTIGSGLSGFALSVWLYQETGSPTLFAISMFVYFLPTVVFAPFAGLITDRFDRRIVMILADSLAGVGTVTVGLLYLTGNLAVWHIYLVHVFYSVANTLQWPAYGAATSQLVPKEHLGRASGMNQIGDAISNLIAPAVAGTLYVSVGLEVILAADIFTYLVAISTLLLVRFPRVQKTEEGEGSKESFWSEVMFGWRYIISRKGFIRLQIILAGLNFCISVSHPLFTPMILELFEPDTLGYMNSIIGVGLLLGTLVMSAWGGPKRHIFGTYFFESLFGLSILLTGVSDWIVLIIAARFLGMFALPLANGNTQTIWLSKIPQDIQGRVFSARRMISFSIIPLAYLAAGPLSEKVFIPALSEGGGLVDSVGRWFGTGPDRGMGLMFVFFGTLYLLICLAILLNRHVRRIELDLPDVVRAEDEIPAHAHN